MFDNVPKNDQFLNQIIIMELNIIVLIFGILFITIIVIVITNKLYIKEKFSLNDDVLNENNTILDILKIISKQNSTAIALKIRDDKEWKNITYDEYYKKVKLFAQCVNKWMGTGVNVGIIGFNSPGWFYSYLGTMLNSGKPIGIYPSATRELCDHIIKNSNIELLVTDNEKQLEKIIKIKNNPIKLIIYYCPIQKSIVDKFENIGIPVVSMGKFMSDTTKLERIPKINDVATIVYSSGTTDKPKGIELTHKNIMHSIKNILSVLKNKTTIKKIGNEKIISYLPLGHISSQLMDIYLPILTLSTVWFANENVINTGLAKTIKDIRPTFFMGMPYIWEKIQENLEDTIEQNGWKANMVKSVAPWKIKNELGFGECKYCFNTSAPMSDICKIYFDELNIKIYDIYGMNETSGPISISGPGAYKPNSVGLVSTDIKISTDNEIYIKGTSLFNKYHNNKSETKKSFTDDGWFKTGDLGKVDASGYLYIIGRKKDIIITTTGEKISPQQLEILFKEKLGKYFEYIVVIGDKRKFLSVILNRGNKNKNVDNNIINKSIEYVNSKTNNKSLIIKKWLIIPNIFSVGDELTPTLKIKRSSIQEKYKKMINGLYK